MKSVEDDFEWVWKVRDFSNTGWQGRKSAIRGEERGKACLVLSGCLNSVPDTIVIDGSNVAHGGANGKGLSGHRVVSAVSEYRKKGYKVITVFKQETLFYMKKNKSPGYHELCEMNENGELHLFRKNDDHLAIILALRHNAWLVTQDTYKTHSIDKPKERDTHPEWFETGKLDILTRGTRVEKDGWVSSGHEWKVVEDDFIDPDMTSLSIEGKSYSWAIKYEQLFDLLTKEDAANVCHNRKIDFKSGERKDSIINSIREDIKKRGVFLNYDTLESIKFLDVSGYPHEISNLVAILDEKNRWNTNPSLQSFLPPLRTL